MFVAHAFQPRSILIGGSARTGSKSFHVLTFDSVLKGIVSESSSGYPSDLLEPGLGVLEIARVPEVRH